MTKVSTRDAQAAVRLAMKNLKATADDNGNVALKDIKDPDLKALAKEAAGSGQKVSYERLSKALTAIGAEIKKVDRQGDKDGTVDYGEAQKLSPMAARLLDWASDGIAAGGVVDNVMHVEKGDIDEAARALLALIKTKLPKGSAPVKLAHAKNDPTLMVLIKAAAERISDESAGRRWVSSGCGGGYYDARPSVSVDDVLHKGVSRTKLREVVSDARAFLTDDVKWEDPRAGEATIENQRSSIGLKHSYAEGRGEGTYAVAELLFERMAGEAEKGNMRPTVKDMKPDEDDYYSPPSSGRYVTSGC